jgi:hypothetical protein
MTRKKEEEIKIVEWKIRLTTPLFSSPTGEEIKR